MNYQYSIAICLCKGIYGFIFFPSNWSSFNYISNNITVNSDILQTTESIEIYSYCALAMFLIMQFCISFGVTSMPNILMGEVFPFK